LRRDCFRRTDDGFGTIFEITPWFGWFAEFERRIETRRHGRAGAILACVIDGIKSFFQIDRGGAVP
jgi:hypothetical protein